MTRNMIRACVLSVLALSAAGLADEVKGVSGRWILTADYYGATRYFRLQLDQQAEQLSGNFNGLRLEGSLKGQRIHFVAKDAQGGTSEVDGVLENGAMSGEIIQKGPEDPAARFPFTGKFVPPLQRTTPQRHEFQPAVYYRQFSAMTSPVLKVAPGDTIHTTTVDAGGNDERGVKRSAGGNPQTGPFYVEGAMPGDTLVVKLTRLRLNRDWAGSDDGIVESGLDSGLAVKMKDNGKSIRWHIDLAKGLASPATPSAHLTNFVIPVHPMLGCIATAPGPAGAPPPTGDSGSWGGNMDFNEVAEGSTIYLPVSNPGALLYLGDGHALQGDGELNGNALETSMDVEFTVDVIPGKRISGVRVETPDALISMGLQGSIDDAFREATSRMAQWLEEDYALTPSELAQVLGAVAEYRVSEVADRNSGVVLKMKKDRLRGLTAVRK